MAAGVQPVAQVLLRPDDVTLRIDKGRGWPASQPVSVLLLQLRAEVEWFVARRKRGGRRRPAYRLHAEAVDLTQHPRHRFGVAALIDPVAKVFLRPDNGAFDVDKGGGRLTPKAVTVLAFKIRPKQKGFVPRRERHVGWTAHRDAA